MYCTNCGIKIDDDALYCNYCGYKIESQNQKVKQDISTNIKPSRLCVLFLLIGITATAIDMVDVYNQEKIINLGQIIFIFVYIIGVISLWRSNKIGLTLLIIFITFRMVISLKYYIETNNRYLLNSLILDEIFYIAIISSVLIEWIKKSKEEK